MPPTPHNPHGPPTLRLSVSCLLLPDTQLTDSLTFPPGLGGDRLCKPRPKIQILGSRFSRAFSNRQFLSSPHVLIRVLGAQRAAGNTRNYSPPLSSSAGFLEGQLVTGAVLHFFFGHSCVFPALRSVLQLMGGQLLGLNGAGFSVIASSPEPVWSLGFAFASRYSLLVSWHRANSENKHTAPSQAPIATNVLTPDIGHVEFCLETSILNHRCLSLSYHKKGTVTSQS